jgi:hypothetical protein
LFGTKDAADLYLGLNAQSQLRSLSGGKIVDFLFDDIFVWGIGFESLVEGDVRVAHALVGGLSFVPVPGDDPPDRLALVGRQTELLDRIGLSGVKRGVRLLGQRERGAGEEYQ